MTCFGYTEEVADRMITDNVIMIHELIEDGFRALDIADILHNE